MCPPSSKFTANIILKSLCWCYLELGSLGSNSGEIRLRGCSALPTVALMASSEQERHLYRHSCLVLLWDAAREKTHQVCSLSVLNFSPELEEINYFSSWISSQRHYVTATYLCYLILNSPSISQLYLLTIQATLRDQVH